MIKKEIDTVGMWFLPECPDEKLSGTLRFNDKRCCQLELSNDFGGIRGFGRNEKVEVIHGFMANGKKVTLLNCIKTNQQLGFPGFPVTQYTSAIAIMGEWYSNNEDVVVSEITASYDYLNYWINSNPFSIEQTNYEKETCMTYCMPEKVICNTGSEIIEFTYKMNINCDYYSNLQLHQSEFVRFKFLEKVHYKIAISKIYDFANFLTLCIGKRISPISITTKNEEGQEVEFIYQRDVKDNEIVNDHELYIKFTYIKDIFENSMKSWLSKKDMLNPIIDYFVEAHDKDFRIPMSFLKVVQAIEAYSRRMRKNEVLPSEEFENKVQSILEGVKNNEDKDLVRSILSNEPRLRQRLTELFKETNYVFKISSTKRKSFINKIVDTRNYYTHFDSSLADKILKPEEMFFISSFMKLILRVLLMQEFGVSKELIKFRMQEDQNLIYIKIGLGIIKSAETIDIIPLEYKEGAESLGK